ncbi:MAG: TRAP transporter small permease [Planctomycetota bacterium]|jgi:TRAP-type C4-dicarboxylate transport system permease small subunit|nr:TRAP transporter small permease [Planctomycetota bacterium]
MRKLYDRFCGIERTLAMIALLATTFLIFATALLRYLGRPVNWSLEISMFIFAWCVFLAADVAFRENRMVNLDLFTNMLPARARLYLAMLCHLIILVFLCAAIYYGFDLAWRTRVRMFHGIDFSYAWVTLSLPVASIFMLTTTCLKMRALAGELFPAPGGPNRRGGEPGAAEKPARFEAP